MSKKKKRDRKIRNNPSGIALEEALQWLYENDFKLERVSGSHHILRHSETRAKVNFQPDKNDKAKSYQIKQAIKAIDDIN